VQKCKSGVTESQETDRHEGKKGRADRLGQPRLSEGAQPYLGLAKGRAKVQIGAKLLCKSAKVVRRSRSEVRRNCMSLGERT